MLQGITGDFMQFFLLVIVGQVMLGLAHFSEKLFSKKSGGFVATGLIYSAGISLSSLVLFAVMAKFNLTLDAPLFWHSFGYGVLASMSMASIFIALKRLNLVVYAVFSKSSSILTCIIGIIFYGDKLTFTSVLSVLLLTISIIMPLLENKKQKGAKSSFVNLLICIAIMFIGTGVSIVVKSFTNYGGGEFSRASALYFYANIIMSITLVGLVCVMTAKKRGGIGFKGTIQKVRLPYYILVPVTGIIANIPCVFNPYCMVNMDLTQYMILTKASESIVLFCISRFIFKEKSTKVDITSLILSTFAGIVTVF